MAKKVEEAEEQAPFWVVAYLDLTQQFLAFFILMFSLSTVEAAKFRKAMESIQEAFGGGQGGRGGIRGPQVPRDLIGGLLMKYPSLAVTGTPLRPVAEGDEILVQRVHEGLKISLEGIAVFPEGSAVLQDSGKGQLLSILALVKGSHNFLEIRGFTSENPQDVSRDGRKDHLELSYQRALAVHDFMVNHKQIAIEPGRLRVAGCGKSSPIVPGTAGWPAGMNRRVEVIVSEELYQPQTVIREDH